MERGDILECVVTRIDEYGFIWVQHGDLIGGVEQVDVLFGSELPAVGDTVKVWYRFATGDDGTIGYDFIGSINYAYPERHPINFVDNSIIGERFVSEYRVLGYWAVVRHRSGVLGALPSSELSQRTSRDETIEVEVTGIDREKKRLLVRHV